MSTCSRRPAAPLRRGRGVVFAVLLAASGLAAQSAHAVPAFARQTGQECAACHVGAFGPQLTQFGKLFKLGGYTMTDGKSGKIPVSAMLVGTFEQTAENQPVDPGPHEDGNDNVNLQEASVFLAGRITDFMGSFVQATYSDISRDVAMDNMDVRLVHDFQLAGRSTTVGVSIINNPTVSGLTNTVPVWRYPYMASELAPGSVASPLIDGGLEGQVMGASVYAMWNGSFYGEVGGYRSLSSSFLDDVNVDEEAGKLSSTSPYWRLAYTRGLLGGDFWAGVFGMNANLHPERAPGRSDKYRDLGVDASWQYLGNRTDVFALNASYITEQVDRDGSVQQGAASSPKGGVDRLDLSASWFHDLTYGLTAAVFDIGSDRDPALYAPDPVGGSRTGKGDTRGIMLQADWTPFGKRDSWKAPWANLRVGLQYTMYDEFNGARTDYDGFNRSANDNNTLFLFAWTAF